MTGPDPAPGPPGVPAPGRRPWLGPAILVVVAVLFGLVLLLPELRIAPPEVNDRVVHTALVSYDAAHWGEHWPVDFWFPSQTAGFPVFVHYPHLSHLAGAALAQLVPGAAPTRVYLAMNYFILAFVPALIFASMRRMGLSWWASSLSAAVYPLAFSDPYLGIGWESFVHNGSGLMPQIWGVALIFPALAWGWSALNGPSPRRSAYLAGLLLAACILSHSVYGYMAAASVSLLLFFPGPSGRWWVRAGRLLMVATVAVAASAYFVVPFVRHVDQVLRSQWEAAWKYDSIGLQGALSTVTSGRMFDAGGPPFLTLLVVVGTAAAVIAAIRHRDSRGLWLTSCLVLWLLLFGGRATWGRLVDWLPFSSGLPMHRFSGGVQVFALVLAGVGLDSIRAAARRRRFYAAIAILAWAVLLAPPVVRRIQFMRTNDDNAARRASALESASDFQAVVQRLRELPPGRVHAGMYYDWGRTFRIGDMPVYTLLQDAGFDVVGYPFMAMAYPAEWQVRTDFGQYRYCYLWNARYVVAPATFQPVMGVLLERRGRFSLFELPTGGYFALGRVDPLAPDALVADSVARAPLSEVYPIGLRWLEGFDLRDPRYLSMEVGEPEALPGPVEGSVDGETVGPGRFGCRVSLAGRADLVLKATFHPFWHCTVDGRAARIVRIFPGFMAVRLDSGTHDVEFRYRAPRYQWWLFALAVVLALAGGGVALAGFRFRAPSGRIRS
jgi:hypothetical protein